MSQLRSRQTTINRFKFPMTAKQAFDVIISAVRVQVEHRQTTFILTSDLERQIQEVAEWMTNSEKKMWLCLCGSCGNGKTTIMRAYCSILPIFDMLPQNRYGNTVRMEIVSAMDVAEECKKSYADFKTLMMKPMLGIDDVGTEPMEMMYYGAKLYPFVDLITKRYEEQLFTMFTTNLDSDGLRERYGERVYDRIREMTEKVAFTNETYRCVSNSIIQSSLDIEE